MSERTEPPKRIFFFERTDGKILAVEESEAWSLYTRRQQVLGKNRRQEFKLIGTGDGAIFYEAVQKAKEAGRTNIAEAQEIIRKGQADELEACRGKIIPPKNMDESTL